MGQPDAIPPDATGIDAPSDVAVIDAPSPDAAPVFCGDGVPNVGVHVLFTNATNTNANTAVFDSSSVFSFYDASQSIGTITSNSGQRTLSISFQGAPAAGVAYGLRDHLVANGDATVSYGEGASVWRALGGSLNVESYDGQTIVFTICDAAEMPASGQPGNTATGSFILGGGGRATLQ